MMELGRSAAVREAVADHPQHLILAGPSGLRLLSCPKAHRKCCFVTRALRPRFLLRLRRSSFALTACSQCLHTLVGHLQLGSPSVAATVSSKSPARLSPFVTDPAAGFEGPRSPHFQSSPTLSSIRDSSSRGDPASDAAAVPQSSQG